MVARWHHARVSVRAWQRRSVPGASIRGSRATTDVIRLSSDVVSRWFGDPVLCGSLPLYRKSGDYLRLHAVALDGEPPREILRDFLRDGRWIWAASHPDGRISVMGWHRTRGHRILHRLEEWRSGDHFEDSADSGLIPKRSRSSFNGMRLAHAVRRSRLEGDAQPLAREGRSRHTRLALGGTADDARGTRYRANSVARRDTNRLQPADTRRLAWWRFHSRWSRIVLGSSEKADS